MFGFKKTQQIKRSYEFKPKVYRLQKNGEVNQNQINVKDFEFCRISAVSPAIFKYSTSCFFYTIYIRLISIVSSRLNNC